MKHPIVVSYGGGVNSTAMLIEMHNRGIVPDAILFADTGGELQRTYDYVSMFSAWLATHDMPTITTVRYNSRHGTLEQECINNKTLPGLAFGHRGCSQKWKRYPMDVWCKEHYPNTQVTRVIGIHAGESHRGKVEDDKRFVFERPLIDWGIDQDGCEAVIIAAGLPVPAKSSCWFCPAMKKREVIDLKREHPCLFSRAVAIEHNAAPNLGVVMGLGRHWSWWALGEADEAQMRLWPEAIPVPCMCDDGGES